MALTDLIVSDDFLLSTAKVYVAKSLALKSLFCVNEEFLKTEPWLSVLSLSSMTMVSSI